MTIHSQFWSPKRLEDVKLVAIDSLLSCKPQEVPKHDILQGLESQPFRCASFHTAQRYLQSADQYLYMFKSYHTAQEWFTTQVSPYHAPIVLVGHLVYRYHFVCVCTIDALETICFLFAFVRTHPNLGVPVVQSRRLSRYRERLPISRPPWFYQGHLGLETGLLLTRLTKIILYPVVYSIIIKRWMIRDDYTRCGSFVQCSN